MWDRPVATQREKARTCRWTSSTEAKWSGDAWAARSFACCASVTCISFCLFDCCIEASLRTVASRTKWMTAILRWAIHLPTSFVK